MKKTLVAISITVGICLLVLNVFAFGEHTGEIKVYQADYPIVINDKIFNGECSQILKNYGYSYIPENNIYLPLRKICDLLNVKIEWNPETETVSINTYTEELIKNFDISKETAVKISEVYFEETFGEDFVKNTHLYSEIEETDEYYLVYRIPNDITMLDGGGGIFISKKDGRLIGTK